MKATANLIGKGVTYAHDKTEDKHYFGGFFNLAQNNINQVFEEFCTRLHANKQAPEEVIKTYFKDNTSYADWEMRAEMLKTYFPITEYLDLPVTDNKFEALDDKEKEIKKREYFRENFLVLLKTIDDLRNFYTHHYHAAVDIEEPVFEFLDSALLKVCTEVKKKRMKNDKTRQALKDSIEKEWKYLEELKREELKDNKKAEKNGIEGLRNSILNDAFYHLICKDKGVNKLQQKYKSKLTDENKPENKTPLSKYGIVFLLSLFLSKRETEQLKANIEGFKGKTLGEDTRVTKKHNSLKFMATHWVFSYLSFKGLKRSINNRFDKLTLLTQMIDELSKVPDELYQTFSKTGKEEFLEDINEYVQDTMGNGDTLQEATVVHPVIRKRYENKFNYFALRFLDEFADFPTLRFQVCAGYYEHDKRPKKIGSSLLITDRVIKKKINVFGRLTDVTKHKADYFSANEDRENWHLYPNPSYNIKGNNIHVYIDLEQKGDKAHRMQHEINELRKKLIHKKMRERRQEKKEIIQKIYNGTSVQCQEPVVLLSLNELPALLYELLVNKKKGSELEGIMVKKLLKKYNTIKDFPREQALSNPQVSRKLIKSKANGPSIDTLRLTHAIDEEIEITGQKLGLIKKNREETREKDDRGKTKRKYVFFTNELGQEATWLANDLIRFMPRAAREKWKGYRHNELQRYLAFYNRHKKDAKELLSTHWDLNADPYWGKEISNAFMAKDFDAFYEAYLNHRKEVLEGFKNSIENGTDLPNKQFKKVLKELFIVFNERTYTIDSTQNQKEQLLAKPLVFDRGIFDDKPTFIKEKKVSENPELFADWYRYCYDSTHEFQKFYGFERDYKSLYKTYKETNKECKQNKKKLNDTRQFELFRKKQDLLIKKIKHHDLFVKLMADHLLKDYFPSGIDFTLKDLYQTKEERGKMKRKIAEERKKEPDNTPFNVFNENFVWNKTVSVSFFDGQLKDEKVKIKDIGKYKKYENDKKVQQLVTYDPEKKPWSKKKLDDELENREDSYERVRREKMLKQVQELEKQILDRYDTTNGHPVELEQGGYPNFKLYLAKGLLQKSNQVPQGDIDWLCKQIIKNGKTNIGELKQKHEQVQKAFVLILLRNTFAHNQLPENQYYKFMMELCPNNKEEGTYSAYFLRVFMQLKNELIK
jgi:hypothetical protein